ncbi:telomere-protecting terminal protein Tpg [Kitasatospora sp. DSM 101779]|uniref:telomere-protecting terminal protein Tpg n=1 Tax=Kitasatospora sp. DSM 101779 TaxID=2853165 RepID=UPI0021DB228B|nr:XRE family transcriptional regulator [Kitasatospora sp. DSM 101779]MCU7820191.1 XRE family transcriptional regulator [Kitasatospora sp. DSM 101779]
MDAIDRGLERAMQTQPIPKTLPGRVNFLIRQLKGTRNVAAALGVSMRSVERWRKGAGIGPDNARKVEDAVRERWQPRVRQRVREAAEARGFTVEVMASFGYTSAGQSTDDPRERIVTQRLPGSVARDLFAARDRGATPQEQQQIIANGLGQAYFQDGGRRARGLQVTLTGLDWADFSV